MIKQLFFVSLLLFLSLEAIPYRKKTSTSEKISMPSGVTKKSGSARTLMTLHVEGIECQVCAQIVVDLLLQCEGVEDVCYKNVGSEYCGGFIEFIWTRKNENIAFDEIKKKIEKKGFEFQAIEGLFVIAFEHKEHEEPACTFAQLNIPLTLENSSQRISKKKVANFRGKVSFEKKRGYIFTIV